jgi:hypothetical protein
MAALLYMFVTNRTFDGQGRAVPNIPANTPYVGHIYTKTGNVEKYLIKTPVDLTGQPGVFGPITRDQLQAALDADGIQDYRGFQVDEVPEWALSGSGTLFGEMRVMRIPPKFPHGLVRSAPPP